MEKNIYSTKIIIALFLVFIISCTNNNKEVKQPITIVEEKRSLAEVEDLYYKIKPLQDTIEYISEYRRNKETLYGVSFSKDSSHYRFSLFIKDQYVIGTEYKMLNKNKMYIILGGEHRLKDTLVTDTLTQYFQKKGKMTFDASKGGKLESFPYIEFIINRDNIEDIKIYDELTSP